MKSYVEAIGIIAIAISLVLGGCKKSADPRTAAKVKTEARRQQLSCASSAANDQLKGRLFDDAIQQHRGDRSNLDMLADYSVVRMEDPVVRGRDDALDVTQCGGRLVLDIPPGAERGLGGERQLQADIHYTAQASADGSGLVYQLTGADALIAKLAAFDLSSGSFRPPPAIDDVKPLENAKVATAPSPNRQVAANVPVGPRSEDPVSVRNADLQSSPGHAGSASSTNAETTSAKREGPPVSSGESVVRAFYSALNNGNGAAASSQVVPEKRSTRAFSPAAMNRFYGRLPEPIQLIAISPINQGSYRVRYKYAAGRSRCVGRAIVTIEKRAGRPLIRSIQSLDGC